MATGTGDLDASFADPLERWCSQWGVPGLARELQVVSSSRLRTSLGLCAPARKEIRVARFLTEGPSDLLLEVVCHEAAHAAVHQLHGRAARPHGREWKSLMQAAGYEAHVRLPASRLRELPEASQRRVAWEHHCPVCRASHSAGRPVYDWRCRVCRGRGRTGELEITRVERGERRRVL